MDAKNVDTQVGNDDLQIQEKLSITTLPCLSCVWTGQGAPGSSQLVTSDERVLTEAVYSTLVYSVALSTRASQPGRELRIKACDWGVQWGRQKEIQVPIRVP